jgi:hypothetical protein
VIWLAVFAMGALAAALWWRFGERMSGEGILQAFLACF